MNKARVQDEYIFDEEEDNVGEGSFGFVFKGLHRRTGILRAIKQIPKEDTDCQEFEDEVNALIALDHPHIVKAIEYFEDKDNFYLVQELCTGPDLFEYIDVSADHNPDRERNASNVSEKAASIILRQCLKALLCCHANGYIHRDIKPENFMISGEDHTIKMIDFGLVTKAKVPMAEDDDVEDQHRDMQFVYEVNGTREYMSPEMFKEQTFEESTDMWSMGVMFYVLMTGEMLLPQETLKEIAMKDNGFSQRRLCECLVFKDRNLSDDARDLIGKMLAYDPNERITPSEALSHPFIRQYHHDILGLDENMSGDYSRKFDKDCLAKLRSFAESPRLKRIALLTMTHIASQGPRYETQEEHVAQSTYVGASPAGRSEHTQSVYFGFSPAVVKPSDSADLLEAQNTFRMIDENGDGTISYEEFKQYLVAHDVELPEDLEKIFSKCTLSSQAGLTYVEFVACYLPSMVFHESLYVETFNFCNRQANGRIEAADLQQLCQSFKYSQQEYQDMIDEADAMGKGHLSLADFVQMLRGDKTLRRQDSLKHIYSEAGPGDVLDASPHRSVGTNDCDSSPIAISENQSQGKSSKVAIISRSRDSKASFTGVDAAHSETEDDCHFVSRFVAHFCHPLRSE